MSAGIAVLVAAVWAWHPARVAVQALLLLPALFPSAPIDPLGRLTPAPSVEQLSSTYTGGTIDAQLFQPASSGQHAAIILLLGAGDLPRSPLAVEFASSLARLGIVTLIPESSGMLAEQLTFDEVDAVRSSVELVRTTAGVDPNRVGLVGLSASGGISIVAAAQPDLRDEVRFVNSFGSYDDAATLLRDVGSRSIQVNGQVQPWQPESRTIDVVRNALQTAGVDGGVADELLGGSLSRDQVQQIIDDLPSAARQSLARISPDTYLSQLHAHLYLMHDVDDPFVPFTQSRELVAQAPAGVVQRYTEFSIFAHVIPERPVPWQTFLPDLWKLFWHVHAVLLEVL